QQLVTVVYRGRIRSCVSLINYPRYTNQIPFNEAVLADDVKLNKLVLSDLYEIRYSLKIYEFIEG
ncbi:MAG: hypothetical protein AAFY91_15555, partial [Bacteroidota bacterium]